jgi:hypothetical protein
MRRPLGTWIDVGAGGLGLTEPPPALAAEVRALGDSCWGTREGTPALRGIGWYVTEAVEEDPDDYVLAAVEDVSTGLALVHQYLVCGPLGLFVQAYLDETGRAALADAGRLQAAVLSPRFVPPDSAGRLVVVDTPLGSSSWRWTGPSQEGGAGGTWAASQWVQNLVVYG